MDEENESLSKAIYDAIYGPRDPSEPLDGIICIEIPRITAPLVREDFAAIEDSIPGDIDAYIESYNATMGLG